MKTSPVFNKIYQDYLNDLESVDYDAAESILGIETEGRTAIIPILNKNFTVSPSGITGPDGDQPSHSLCVILVKYLLLCPDRISGETEWVGYRNFHDAAPFVEGFTNTVERVIAHNFSGKCGSLKAASETIGGYPPSTRLSYDLAMRFDMLPRIPVLLLFNDEDDLFPADCKVLFEKRAETFLDMECLAMLGMILARYLSVEQYSRP